MTHTPLSLGPRCYPHYNVVLILAHHLRRWPSIKSTFYIKYTRPRFYASESVCASSCASASSTQTLINKVVCVHVGQSTVIVRRDGGECFFFNFSNPFENADTDSIEDSQ